MYVVRNIVLRALQFSPHLHFSSLTPECPGTCKCVHGGELYPCAVPALQVDFLEAGAAQSSVIAGVHPWGLTFSREIGGRFSSASCVTLGTRGHQKASVALNSPT